MIVEVIGGVLYPLRYDTEEGKDNLIEIILYTRSQVCGKVWSLIQEADTPRSV